MNGITFNGVTGDGSGQTIAIVDAYDDAEAAVDLNAFSTYYHLPTFNSGAGSPTFKKLNQTGGTTLPAAPPANDDWTGEESLDIEWAHVMAPMANIILFEANDDTSDGLYIAAQTAATTPGVAAVSMSWSGDEFAGETSFDSTYYSTQPGHGVTFLSAADDTGSYGAGTEDTTITPQYPATSPNVVSVGGTSVSVNGTDPNYTWASEAGWGDDTASGTSRDGSGGGISAYEPQPVWQNGVVDNVNTNYNTTQRCYPDVSCDANPFTGVPVYDPGDFGASTPWGQVGGTSLATPLWAGIITVADQGRVANGQGTLDGPSETLPLLYSLSSSGVFHDITTCENGQGAPTRGNGGYDVGPGYDCVTGMGSPIAPVLMAALAGEQTTSLTFTPSQLKGTYRLDRRSHSDGHAHDGRQQSHAPGW